MNITAQNPSVSVESLSLVAHNNTPVITTDLLAKLYGTKTDNIRVNFSSNADRFVEGKHFFKLEGQQLKDFKNSVSETYSVGKNARSLILWTERGAARHAKMLDTDQAWDVFEKLEDCYFSKPPVAQLALTNGQHFIVAKDGVVIYHKPLSERTSHRYLQPRVIQALPAPECQKALALLTQFQSLPTLGDEVEYWELRRALRALLDSLHQYQPSSSVVPAIAVLSAAEAMFMRMYTIITESSLQAHSGSLAAGHPTTINSLRHTLSLPLNVWAAH